MYKIALVRVSNTPKVLAQAEFELKRLENQQESMTWRAIARSRKQDRKAQVEARIERYKGRVQEGAFMSFNEYVADYHQRYGEEATDEQLRDEYDHLLLQRRGEEERLQAELAMLKEQLIMDFFTVQERDEAEKTFLSMSDNKEEEGKIWRGTLQRMVQACTKQAHPEAARLHVRTICTSRVARIQRQSETEFKWAQMVEREVEFGKWLTAVWEEGVALGREVAALVHAAFTKFTSFLSQVERHGFIFFSVEDTSRPTLMTEIVAKCRVIAEEQGDVHDGQRCFAIRRAKDEKLVKKVKKEGHNVIKNLFQNIILLFLIL
jgi:hypothetical protein